MESRALHNGSDGASDSPYEGLQENDTEDSFGKRMIREMRAENTRPQAFRRARQRARHGLTAENVERIPVAKDGATPEYVQRQAGSVTSSGDSRGSDPPPNVPKSWGGRSRKPEWLKRRFAAEVEAFSETLKTGSTDAIDWSAIAVDIPLPSVEDTPLSHKSSRRSTPVGAGTRRNTKLEEIVQLEQDEDFSMRDFITSTPAAVARNTKLDEIRQLELENAISDAMDESIYPTPPPEEARRRRSSRDDRRQSGSSSRREDLSNSWDHPAEQKISVSKRTIRKSPSIPLTNDNGPVSPGKSSFTVGDVDRGVQPDVQTNVQRPENRREDSQDILRRLARATSGTPSPSRVFGNAITALSPKKNKQARFKEESRESESVGVASVKASLNDGHSSDSTAPKQRDFAVISDQQAGANGESLLRQHNEQDTNPKATVEISNLENPPSKVFEPKTPIVTGAWIETPKAATVSHRPRSIASSSTENAPSDTKPPSQSPQRPSTAPPNTTQHALPPSALTAVLSSSENGLGDSTITSLEDMLSGTAAPSDDVSTTELAPAPQPRTPAEQLRHKELQTLAKMNAALRATRDSIRDAKLGIGRVERAVQSGDGGGAGAAGAADPLCARCAAAPPPLEPANAPLVALAVSLKGVAWYVAPGSGAVRLTWLALALALAGAWFWAEFFACALFCRRVYSWDGTLRPDAPEWPLVIPTLLLRPVAFVWRPLVGAVGPLLGWLWDFACFLWDDRRLREEWRSAATKTAVKVLSTATREWFAGSTAVADSMDNDEYL